MHQATEDELRYLGICIEREVEKKEEGAKNYHNRGAITEIPQEPQQELCPR